MKNTAFAILLLIVSLLSCNKRKEKCEGGKWITMEFDIPFTITPATDTIHLGDTLWVVSVFDPELLNKRNDKKYTVANKQGFTLNFNINDMMLENVVPITDYFVVDSAGNYLPNTNPDGDNTNTISYNYYNGKCHYKRGFVILRRGLFELLVVNFMNYSGGGVTGCPNENINVYPIINDGNIHFHLVQYSLDEHFKSYSEDQVRKGGSYFVCVI